MKRFICFVTILGSLSAFAVDSEPSKPCAHCEVKEASGNPVNTDGLAKVAKFAENIQSKEMEDLSNKICTELIKAQNSTGENSAIVIQREILNHLNITKKKSNYKKEVTKFWNDNLNQMVCTTPSVNNTSPQHLMKRVIEMGLNKEVYFNFIFELADNINVNAVENGETVIDYIDSILSNPDNETKYVFREIKDLREVLVDFYGAKKASDF